MDLRKLVAALVVALSLFGVAATGADASATTSDATWRIGTSGTVLTGSEAVTSTGNGEFVTEVGTTKLRLKYTGLECIGCGIENSGGTAIGTGKLKFTGVTVTEPAATCAVEGGSVTTVGLKIDADYMIGTETFVKIESASGTTLATFKLIKGSGSCVISGTYSVTGNFFGKLASATGVYATSQSLNFSGAIDAEAGGGLKWGAKPFEIKGPAAVALAGPNKGVVFGTHE